MTNQGAIIRVGDHTPDLSPVHVAPQRAVELWAIERAQYSVGEFESIAGRYGDAARKLRGAVDGKDFAALRSAYLDLAEIADQAAFLNGGLQTIIESTRNRSTKR
jgi:hypothetical protein